MNDAQPAAQFYSAELEAVPKIVLIRRLGFWFWFLVGMVSLGAVDVGAPSVGDLVVRHRTDGREFLRIDAGSAEEAGPLLGYVREQLATLPAEEFKQRWKPQRR